MKIHFTSKEEFEEKFNTENPEIAFAFLQEIDKSFGSGKKSTVLLTVSVEGADEEIEIILNRAEWSKCLAACMEIFRKADMVDEAIDAYSLKKKIEESL